MTRPSTRRPLRSIMSRRSSSDESSILDNEPHRQRSFDEFLCWNVSLTSQSVTDENNSH
jgi:hypothetical protein